MSIAAVGVAVRRQLETSAVAGSATTSAATRANVVVELVEQVVLVSDARVLLSRRCCAGCTRKVAAERPLPLRRLAQDHVELG